ncbi:MAG: hypothetical protein ACRCYS_03700 [Beijerinckiaceae bacterium]
MVDYTVFECYGALELAKEAKEAGFRHIWAPTMLKRLTRVRHVLVNGKSVAQRYAVLERVLAYPGYISLPLDEWRAFRDWASPKFRVKLMMQLNGTGHFRGAAPMRPCIIPLSQILEEREVLYQLDRRMIEIERAYKVKAEHLCVPVETIIEEEKPPLPIGGRMMIMMGIFKGLECVVQKVGKKEVQVDIGSRKVWISPSYLAKS